MMLVALVFAVLVVVGDASAASDDPSTALRVLRGLESATQSGVTFPDYSRRLADTTIVVNEFLRTVTVMGPTIDPIIRTLGYYQAASVVWQILNERRLMGAVGLPPGVFESLERYDCPHLGTLRELGGELAGSRVVSTLWRCAAEELQRAEVAAQ